jgi:hypothetical protein
MLPIVFFSKKEEERSVLILILPLEAEDDQADESDWFGASITPSISKREKVTSVRREWGFFVLTFFYCLFVCLFVCLFRLVGFLVIR